jgi:hypothetical protein
MFVVGALYCECSAYCECTRHLVLTAQQSDGPSLLHYSYDLTSQITFDWHVHELRQTPNTTGAIINAVTTSQQSCQLVRPAIL